VISLLFFSDPTIAQTPSIYEKDGNIFFKDSSGSETQLTTWGLDTDLALSPNGKFAVFVRTTDHPPIEAGSGETAFTELWIVDIYTRKMDKIVESQDSETVEALLAGFSSPQFSEDSNQVFFLSEAWATSSSVQKVDLQTKKVRFVTAGNSLEVVRDGKYKSYLKINQHRYKKDGSGSYDCDYIFTPEGKEIALIKKSCDQ
jgi:hypothetical protein